MKIKIKDFGASLGSRTVGEEIRHAVKEAIDQGEVVILDFSGVTTAAPSFIDELFGVLFSSFDITQLRGKIKVESALPEVQSLIRRMISLRIQEKGEAYQAGAQKSNPGKADISDSPKETLNPFELLRKVQDDYLSYVRTYQRFQNPEIGRWVLDHIQNGSLLWKPPYVQIARPFQPGERLEALVEQQVLHPGVLPVFRRDAENPASAPLHPHLHQTQAARRILAGRNVIVATGTGSGKSFAFGIPIVSECLRRRSQGVKGIQAVIVYPMNALANSQYDEFARRLHTSGLRLALYTGDTANSPAQALQRYRESTGRMQPYDSEVLSREEIQHNPPDILMTNYVMLELILTRFEDRTLFAHPGVLQFLVLDEVHTYSGKRGADVAALIRRLKQHTGTAGQLRCIGTSATVESGGQESAAQAISAFAQELFGEAFSADDVIGETYAPLPAEATEIQRRATQLTARKVRSLVDLSQEMDVDRAELESQLLQMPGLPPKLHAFFSQGRAIAACLDAHEPHLNDRGELICPVCAEQGRDRPTYMMVFCRACGQEYYSVAVGEGGRLVSAELDDVDAAGRSGYLYLQPWDEENNPLPNHWLTPTGKLMKKFREAEPQLAEVCPECGELNGNCHHARLRAFFIPAPFLFCPNCGISHDRRSREFNKLFTFGSVGRSTATDVLISAQIRGLPARQKKVIAFSDNRQDTALQAAHMNSLHNRLAFRRALHQALRAHPAGLELDDMGRAIFETLRSQDLLPKYSKSERRYGGDPHADERYQEYLVFLTLQELRGTNRRTHQNLEDVGLLRVQYAGLDEFAADTSAWYDIPQLAGLDVDRRYDFLLGFLDLMRKRLAILHPHIVNSSRLRMEVLARLNSEALAHDDEFYQPIGYSDEAPDNTRYTRYRFSGGNTQTATWVRRALDISGSEVTDLIGQMVAKLVRPEIGFLQKYLVRDYQTPYDLYMIPAEVIRLEADSDGEHLICPKCLSVHSFRRLRACTGSTCRTELEHRDVSENYFRRMYTLPLLQAGRVKTEEHSGQVSGEERRKIEINFRDPLNPLNVLICTPTMELGIDIGALSAVTLRNVPPSPSNYAQRAGRAGRSGQPSLISVFAGVGAARGPHDQYFYRFPERMIAGAIAAPRFRLDNPFLLKAHIHALVLETMGRAGGERLPSRPRELLNLEMENAPLYPDLAAAWRAALEQQRAHICEAVYEAFAQEMGAARNHNGFEWFTRDFVSRTVESFVDDLDLAMDRWRIEYRRLDDEREGLNRILGTEGVDASMNRRRTVIEAKLEDMRNGEGDWYVYRYLGGEGFLPAYAFPPAAIHLSFDQVEDELARSPAIALSEYAPGNFVYYRGERYEVTHGRPKTRQLAPETEPILVCPACQRSYTGDGETTRAACDCGQDLQATHPRLAMPLCDMFAMRRASITADEEERLRLGYEITPHYARPGHARRFIASASGQENFRLTLENESELLLINHGPRNPQGQSIGFTLCLKCFAWLMSDNAVKDHVRTPSNGGDCPQGAHEADLLHGLWLTDNQRSDLAIFDIPAPDGVDSLTFYTTLKNALLRSILVAFQVDESELGGFLLPDPSSPQQSRIILYETAIGGSGVLSSLGDTDRMNALFARMVELLHGSGDAGGGQQDIGCEKACYECLLSFYNQRDHHLLDRRVVLEWLAGGNVFEVIQDQQADPTQLETLRLSAGSQLERLVLDRMVEMGIRLPDASQKPIYETNGAPVAVADLYYNPRIVVFIDGSPHSQDYVQDTDGRRRQELRRSGYRVVVIRGDTLDQDLLELKGRLA